jgi:hypothetical protein
MSLLAAGRVLIHPVDGQEGFEFSGRWVVHELFEDPFEVGKGVCLVGADLLNEGADEPFL